MKIVRIISYCIMLIAVVAFIVVGIIHSGNQLCSNIKVTVHTQNESVLLTQEDIEKALDTAHIAVKGIRMKEINVNAISQLISQNPYVEKINFVHGTNKSLVIDYTMRHIVLHVFNENGDQYFVDANQNLLPYTTKMKDYLIIANGNIHQSYKKGATTGKELTPVVELTKEILADEFCTAQFRQIYLNCDKQMELVSTAGNQIILFGTSDNAAEKLAKLKQVYQNGMTRKGFDQYAQLDVRYKNRIIATKK